MVCVGIPRTIYVPTEMQHHRQRDVCYCNCISHLGFIHAAQKDPLPLQQHGDRIYFIESSIMNLVGSVLFICPLFDLELSAVHMISEHKDVVVESLSRPQ
jgi:hypothetical protein